MKSIRYVVQKYKGEMLVYKKERRFVLEILFASSKTVRFVKKPFAPQAPRLRGAFAGKCARRRKKRKTQKKALFRAYPP